MPKIHLRIDADVDFHLRTNEDSFATEVSPQDETVHYLDSNHADSGELALNDKIDTFIFNSVETAADNVEDENVFIFSHQPQSVSAQNEGHYTETDLDVDLYSFEFNDWSDDWF